VKKLAIFYGSIALVVLSLPIVMAAANRITGGAVGNAIDAVVGGGVGAVSGGGATAAPAPGAVEGPTGARLLVI
jgi:hypothetical protein